ncbi:MAG TPA: flagellar basal body rod protein FlgB [Terriglobales bacterium]|nr:flagellar basal body rod protein FlgB [Terriglobales bacterium]
MSDNMIETPLMRGLERALDQAASRHQVLSTNIANVDTPRYHTRDVPAFAGEIERAMAADNPDVPALPPMTPVAREVRGLVQRPDGNNVSAERESLLLAQNQLRFEVAVAFLKAEFHRLSAAINGGATS